MGLHEFVQANVGLAGLVLATVTSLGGFLLGNHLALGREKRKEFNDAALPIRAWALRELDGPSPYTKPPTREQIDLFIGCLHAWSRSGFRRAYQAQQQARERAEYQNSVGEVLYRDTTEIRKCVQACLPYTARR